MGPNLLQGKFIRQILGKMDLIKQYSSRILSDIVSQSVTVGKVTASGVTSGKVTSDNDLFQGTAAKGIQVKTNRIRTLR